jgi:zinc/manganese transport system substrate-binding protein
LILNINSEKEIAMQKLNRVFYLAFVLLGLSLTGCNGESEPAATDGKLQVVATYSILGDLALNVGREAIALTTLVGPGSDTHTFEASPADTAALSQAGLILENGLGFEGWLDELYESSESTAERVVVTDGLALLAAGEAHEHEEAAEHEHGDSDPHVWHSVANAILMVRAIRDALVEADPANAETYQANADAYIAELQALDQWVFEQVAQLPEERRKLVTSHDTFSYFAERYGFEIAGTALGSISTETADPSAGEMAELVETIRTAGVPAIFAEEVASSEVMAQIAAEAGVTLGPPLYSDALGEAGSEGDSYVKMMQYNVTTIVNTLQGS